MQKSTSEVESAKGWWLWWLAVVLLMLAVSVIGTAWVVERAARNADRLTDGQKQFALAVVQIPIQMKAAVHQVIAQLGGPPYPLLREKSEVETAHWVRSFPQSADTGFLLLSAADPKYRQSTVKLLRISDGRLMAQWVPDWREILAQHTPEHGQELTEQNVRAMHPVLMPDGDIVFNTLGALVRLAGCTGQVVWVNPEIFHHSTELDQDGNIWSLSVAKSEFQDNPWLKGMMRDESIAKVSPDGKLLMRLSFTEIMRKNGMLALLLGTQGNNFNYDPIHLNQVVVAERDAAPHWLKGDLLISSRHLSTVFLYRPATGKIVWHKTGPWMNQHSTYFVGDHQIIVFNNNVFGGAPVHQPFVTPGAINEVMFYDFKTGQVTEPFKTLLEKARPVTMTEGRVQLLPDGGLFVEESNFGRHLRFTKDKLLWSRVNDYDDKHIGIVSWSRYLTAQEVEAPLRALAAKQCAAGQLH